MMRALTEMNMAAVRTARHNGARRQWITCTWLAAFVAMGVAPTTSGQSTQAPVVGTIESIVSNDPTHTDRFAGGVMMVGRNRVIIPRNMILVIPANWLTLTELFQQAPAACLAAGETGLSSSDTCLGGGVGGVASVLGNRLPNGDVIAGEILIEKGQEALIGVVTHIDYTDGFFRVNGTMGDPATGVMVRLNDPDGRHTVQQGAGCDGGPNCSADPRYTNDPDNYTFVYSTGYPVCIPSTVTGGNRTTGADANGNGDPFCPQNNRSGASAADSRLFAPMQVGDSIAADGNYETISGTTFLSAHTILVMASVTTADSPNQPDYIIFDEVEWDTAGFQNERVRALFIGFSTLGNTHVDLYSLQVDNVTGENHEVILASTAGCEAFAPGTCLQQGTPPTDVGVFKIRYDVDFIEAAANAAVGDPPVKPRFSPCFHLENMNHPDPNVVSPCTPPFTIEEEFSVLVPMTRELIGRSRHKLSLNPGIETLDIRGNLATNGEYLTPVGIGHPEFGEINLAALQTPFNFEGQVWNLDARLSPVGCEGLCTGVPLPLDPFPCSGLDPRTQASLPAAVADRISSFWGSAGASSLFYDLDTFNCASGTASVASFAPPPPPPSSVIANAGADAIVLVNEVVQLNGTASAGTIDTFAWTQLAGDPVILRVLQPGGSLAGDGTNTAGPAFIFPSTPQTLTFQLTVTGPGGTSVDLVNVGADDPLSADTIEVDRAEYKENKGSWRIEGTSSIPGPGHAVSVYLGTAGSGTLIGTAAVDALGDWRVDTADNSPADPTSGGPETITAQSSLGGTETDVEVDIK